jgi:glycosyltransferase involved in cell wall biosynthesis
MYPTPLVPVSGTFVEQQIKSLTQIGLDVDVMFVDRAQAGMRAYLPLGRKIRDRVAKCHPDVVHIMYGGVMADEVTRTIQDRPTVVSFCGSDLLGETLSGSVRKLISEYGVLASYRAARRATGIVVKSKNLENALPTYVRRSKVRIIPNGIDLERFKSLDRDQCRNRLGWDPNTFHILFPANSGDPVKRPKLAQAAVDAFQRMRIRAEMHYLRGVPNNEVPVWLNGSNVLLVTSQHEGSPNIVKEALACNLPIVSVDVGDVSERVEGIEGCHIGLPDPHDLAVKLSLVHSGKGRIAGRVKMQEFSLERIALRLKKVYSDVLN